MEIKFSSVEEVLEFADRYRGPVATANPGVFTSAELASELGKLVRTQSIIQAIKTHRKLTGLGLKESKEAIDRFWPFPRHRM